MAALSRKMLKNVRFLASFGEKQPVTVKLSKLWSERFHRDTDRRILFKFREIWLTGICEIVRCISDKK